MEKYVFKMINQINNFVTWFKEMKAWKQFLFLVCVIIVISLINKIF